MDDGVARTAGTENLHREIFQMSDKLLIEFSKSSSSWETVFAVLNIPDLSDAQYFQASNIFKNKLKIDFVTLKYQGGADMGTKIRDKLFQIVKSFCALNKPAFIMENMCLGFAYIIMHVHQEWPTLINDLVNSLSNTQSEVISLLKIVGFMASEADDDNVVIEESLRE